MHTKRVEHLGHDVTGVRVIAADRRKAELGDLMNVVLTDFRGRNAMTAAGAIKDRPHNLTLVLQGARVRNVEANE